MTIEAKPLTSTIGAGGTSSAGSALVTPGRAVMTCTTRDTPGLFSAASRRLGVAIALWGCIVLQMSITLKPFERTDVTIKAMLWYKYLLFLKRMIL